MKKTMRIWAIMLTVLIVMGVFSSCGSKLSGTYTAWVEPFSKTGVRLTFQDDRVRVEVLSVDVLIATMEGKYTVKGDEITMEFPCKTESEKELLGMYNGTFDFKRGKDFIQVGVFGKFVKESS